MAMFLGRDDVGIDVQSEFRSETTVLSGDNRKMNEDDIEDYDEDNEEEAYWNLYYKLPYSEMSKIELF